MPFLQCICCAVLFESVQCGWCLCYAVFDLASGGVVCTGHCELTVLNVCRKVFGELICFNTAVAILLFDGLPHHSWDVNFAFTLHVRVIWIFHSGGG